MIVEALQELCDKIDQTLANKFGHSESKLVLDNLVAQDGTVSTAAANKIVVSVISFGIDISLRNAKPITIQPQGRYDENNASDYFSTQILIASNLNNYNSGLVFLEAIAIFLNKNPTLIIPGQENRKLTIASRPSSQEEVFGLWKALGARLVPHLIYTVKSYPNT